MSQIESETKPIFLKMLHGQKCKLSKDELHLLCFWVVLKVVVAEFAEKNESLNVTPYRERRSMMKEKKIPPYFNIFLGLHSTGHVSAWLRHSWTMAFSPKGPTPALENRQRNAQSISFMIGPVFIYVLHVRLLGFLPEAHFKFGKMRKIWPSKMSFIRWPQKPLKRVETDVIAFMTQDLSESDEVKHVPDMPN